LRGDQRDILLPPLTQRILLGLWFGLLQIGVLAWLYRRLIRNESRRRRILAAEESLQRDLVITGTCLPREERTADEDFPDDLYFYARAGQITGPSPFGARGVSLNDPRYRHMLLDVIMGSGSIFPMFPTRVLHDFPAAGESVELVDGGFAHASPIEAAVEWGATHVIVIETSPETRSTRKNFVANLAAAVGHLYQQTQQVDRRSKQHVRVFTLEPRPPHLCILCFADNLIDRAMCSGYFDASGTRHPDCRHPEHLDVDQSVTGHWFEEDLGPPSFVVVDS
jgi:hypothetical protein